MSRRKKHQHMNHERWLISYADFITLLFAFFVVLFASSQADKKKQVQLATSIQSAFNQMGAFEARSKLPPLSQTPGESGSATPALKAVAAPEQAMGRIEQLLNQAAKHEIDSGIIAIHESSAGLTVSLKESGFFDSGAADVRPTALPVLERIAAALPASPLRVEGHTDNVPINTTQFASNWELSSSRASSIARLLLHYPNIHPEELSVAGYAEFHPVASNATAEGRARNRRVDIVILAPSR